MITVPSNELVGQIHDRMPAILFAHHLSVRADDDVADLAAELDAVELLDGDAPGLQAGAALDPVMVARNISGELMIDITPAAAYLAARVTVSSWSFSVPWRVRRRMSPCAVRFLRSQVARSLSPL